MVVLVASAGNISKTLVGYYDSAKQAAIAYNEFIDINNLEHTKNII